MGLLPWTFACITLLVVMASGLFHTVRQHHDIIRSISGYIQESDKTLYVVHEADVRTYHETAKVPPEPPILRRKSAPHAVRLSSRLHISKDTFIQACSSTTNGAEPAVRILHTLLLKQYPDIGKLMGQTDEEAIHTLLEAVAEAMQRYEGKCSFKEAKILANFELTKEVLQDPYWQMLAGRDARGEVWRSLLSLISFKNHAHITSLWSAPPPVLAAIFDEKSVDEVSEFIEQRTELYQRLRQKKKEDLDPKASVEEEFRSLCEKMLPSWLPSSAVDLSVSSTAPKK